MEYFDGELDSGLRQEVAEHVASCPRCQQELRNLESLGKLLKQAQSVEALTPDESQAYYLCVCRKLAQRRAWPVVYGLAVLAAIAGSLMLFGMPRTPLYQIMGLLGLISAAGIVWLGQYCRSRS
jgi:anti-sigma factor RsiW